MAAKTLNKAKRHKADEFYTQLPDIENEMKHYKDRLRGKSVFCNCDDPQESNFWKYFYLNFDHLGLRKLTTTHYTQNAPSYTLEYDGKNIVANPLKGNGDFRSPECVELLKKCDVIATNPPFSLFREYVAQLMEYGKNFIIIGNINAITYKEVFKLIKENKIWLGQSIHGGDREFRVPNYYPLQAAGFRVDEKDVKYIRVKGVRWFTNLEIPQRRQILPLYRRYIPDKYPHYDNYEAINIDKISDIPDDYDGAMGVPVTFLDKYNPDQFEIVDGLNRYTILDADGLNGHARENRLHMTKIKGETKYIRIVVKRKEA